MRIVITVDYGLPRCCGQKAPVNAIGLMAEVRLAVVVVLTARLGPVNAIRLIDEAALASEEQMKSDGILFFGRGIVYPVTHTFACAPKTCIFAAEIIT